MSNHNIFIGTFINFFSKKIKNIFQVWKIIPHNIQSYYFNHKIFLKALNMRLTICSHRKRELMIFLTRVVRSTTWTVFLVDNTILVWIMWKKLPVIFKKNLDFFARLKFWKEIKKFLNKNTCNQSRNQNNHCFQSVNPAREHKFKHFIIRL